MTRADVRTFAWLVPLALGLEISWMFWGGYLTSYLAYGSADTWVAEAPVASAPAATAAPSAPCPPSTSYASSEKFSAADTVQVENPYGIPSALETGADIAIPIAIVLLVGFLSAQNFQHHAGRRAAAVMFIALFIAKASIWVAFVRRNSYYDLFTVKDWMANIAVILIVALAGAAFAWLAATLILRWRARG